LANDTRKPHQQLLLEFKSMLAELLREAETSVERRPSADIQLENRDDVIIQSRASKFFCGEQRTSSPFDDSSGNEAIGPAEVAILQSMVTGGHMLSFKAHFLSELPSLLPLSNTLTHLNVSFNCLQVFPKDICQLTQLKDLRLRNNPIREIPSAIRSLKSLQLLSIPFNLLTDLPQGLFELYSLEELDVSHNSLQWISRDIQQLCNLKRLNVQCNQLSGLPVTTLNIQLQQLLVDSNYFHQLLWKENTHNSPQMLSDMCCTVLAKHSTVSAIEEYPQDIQALLNNPTGTCDYCQGAMYGCGLRAIRSINNNNNN
uniref:Disease resistance R13L4/SHOC-2-like LRR domain-containing protein n=1 Tax=Amphimedon queenslandica TaxID=400682 RepID=A0A1X7T4Q5_AMPQE